MYTRLYVVTLGNTLGAVKRDGIPLSSRSRTSRLACRRFVTPSYQRRAATAALVVRRKAAGEQEAHSRAKTLSAAAPYINVSVKYVKFSSDQEAVRKLTVFRVLARTRR